MCPSGQLYDCHHDTEHLYKGIRDLPPLHTDHWLFQHTCRCLASAEQGCCLPERGHDCTYREDNDCTSCYFLLVERMRGRPMPELMDRMSLPDC